MTSLLAMTFSGCSGAGSAATPPILPGALGFAAASFTVAQTAGSATITVSRTGGFNGAVSVAYATSNGTATAGADYTAVSGTLNWADMDSSPRNITVPISSASPFNGARVFTVALSAPTGGATVGSISSNAVTITGAWIPPSSYAQFDFSKWKLQLPIDQYGGTGGLNNIQYANVEVQPAQLTTGFTDAYFYADKTGDAIFTAPSNGAVTTPGVGSDHTRSELRELYTGTGADSNSDWNSTIGGTLTATCKVLSVSADSDEATIAQIHGQTYVFMPLMYRPALKDIAVDIYATNTSTSGHTRTSMVTGVNLSDTVTYSVQYSGNTVTATVNGVIKSFPIDSSWAGSPMYFKLGAYHAAPNSGNPAGDQTQVSFSAFAVSH
jgi:hypothetical protein